MRSPWRSHSLAAIWLLALTLGALAPVHLRAQAAGAAAAADAASEDDDEQPTSFLAVTITLDAAGKATANASYHVIDQPNLPATEIKAALQSALGCTLQDSTRLRSMTPFYVGSCTVSSSRGFLRQGRISTASLQDFCRLHNITFPTIQLQLPDSDVLETIPAATQAFPKLPAAVTRYMRAFFVFTASVEKPFPPQIVFRYGYASSNLERYAALLFLALFAPLGLFMWLGRKALSADVADKAVVWFSYMRWLHWILNGSLIAWWIALEYCHAETLLEFVSSGTRFAALVAHPAAYQAISWVPPAMVWLLCYRISHPVQQKLRGLRWTKRELTLQALYSALAGLFPFALFLTGLRVIATSGFRSAMYWWVAAFLLRVVAAQALLKLTGMQPQALSSGDLRDRAFAFAERLGVKLQQVYLIPSGKGQMANAFARTGNTISFTDFLLQRMSQREVDYVMAHELTHLKLKHPAKLGYAYMGGLFLALFILDVPLAFFFRGHALAHQLSMFTSVLHSGLARYVFIFIIISIFPYFWSRRFEYAADAGAVSVTGDPRAAISALFKLSELNMMPLHWSNWREKWLTHPSGMRRARAIAKKAGISFEEIPAIARDGAAETQNYAIPATAGPGARVHSTHRNKSLSLKLSFALVGLFAFVPSLCCLAAMHFASPVNWILFAAAIPATLLGFLLFSNYVPRFIRSNVVASLNKKLAGQGIDAKSWSGVFVGFAPAAAPRLYEGNANWDIGYLFFRSDRLCYWGEETKFALHPKQITAIKLGDGMPSLLPNKRIYIAWKDEERGASGVFNIGRGKGGSTLHANKLTTELAERLQAWWKTPPITRPMPPQLAELASPETRAVTSQNPAERRKPKKLYNELTWTAIFSAVGATLCGLPFHLFPYLLDSRNPAFYARVGIHAQLSTPGAGWFAVAVAVLVRFITLCPIIGYRDTPRLNAEPPARRPGASPVTQPESALPEKIAVS